MTFRFYIYFEERFADYRLFSCSSVGRSATLIIEGNYMTE
jgi:hypothetical protein